MSKLELVSTEIRNHHRLIIWLAVIGALFFAYLKYAAYRDGVAHDNRVIAEDQLKQTQTANKQFDQEQVARDKAYQDLVVKTTQALAQSAAANAALKSQLAKQQETDKALPLPDLTKRWASQVELPPEEFTVAPPDKVVAPDAAVRITVQNLDELQTDRQIIPGLEKQNSLLTGQTQACQADNESLHEQVGRKDSEIKQMAATCEAEKKDLKRQVAKAKRRGLIGWIAAGLEAYLLGKKF